MTEERDAPYFSLMKWQNGIQTFLDRFLVPIDDPGSRLFYMNLIMTLVFLVIFYVFSMPDPSPRGAFLQLRKWVWRKKYWWNSSTKIDYQIYFLNALLKVLIFIPWLDFSYYFSKQTVIFLNSIFHQAQAWPATPPVLFAFTVLVFCYDDFLRFIHHYLMHKVSWLWHFHQTHHSAKILTPITLYRAHPVEVLIATVRNALSAGVAVGVFVYLFSSQVSYFQILSINIFGFAFNFLGSNLRHSHIPVSFGILENVFISPKQHQIHHSQKAQHFDKNFGVSLSVWDRLIGSLITSDQVNKKMSFGLRNMRAWRLREILFPKSR